MTLRLERRVALPPHTGRGGFGGAAAHPSAGRLFVAHPANHAVHVLDTRLDLYLYALADVRGAAGVLVAPELDEIFVAADGEGKLAFFQSRDRTVETMVVGRKPNCLAWDAARQTLWVGRGDARSWGITVVDFARAVVCGEIETPAPPTALVFDSRSDVLYAAMDGTSPLLLVEGANRLRVARQWELPAPARALVVSGDRLYAACAGGDLLALDTKHGALAARAKLSGEADALAILPASGSLYVALAVEGALAVYDLPALALRERVPTEPGARTLACDTARHKVFVLSPGACSVLVYREG